MEDNEAASPCIHGSFSSACIAQRVLQSTLLWIPASAVQGKTEINQKTVETAWNYFTCPRTKKALLSVLWWGISACLHLATSKEPSVKTLLTLAQYKLLNIFMRWPGTGLSFEIQIPSHTIINAFSPGENNLYLHSGIKLLSGLVFFDQFQVRTLITRH